MKGQNIKKYQQNKLNLMCKTDKKTRNYIFFFAVRQNAQQKPRKLNTQKCAIFLLERAKQNTGYNIISLLLL